MNMLSALAVTTTLTIGQACLAQTLHVPGDFSNIQDAIDFAGDGFEIIVAPGTYTDIHQQVVDFDGKAIWLHSSGGPAVTTIHGETIHRGIVCVSEEGPGTIIEGFTVLNCYGGNGAGMLATNSSPLVKNCIFLSNIAINRGGGMEIAFTASPTLTNCTFQNNRSNQGAGLHNSGINPVLTACVFTNNIAFSSVPQTPKGGGMMNTAATATLNDCTFTGNLSQGHGGGMYNEYDSTPVLTNCSFTNNDAADNGGGMFNYQSSPSLTGCLFTANDAFQGGGMCNHIYSSPTLADCTFSMNTASNSGGGMENYDHSDPQLTGCSFSSNQADNDGGGMRNEGSEPVLAKCLFTSNLALDGGGGMRNDNSNAVLSGCVFDNNDAGFGAGMMNASSEPSLTDVAFNTNTAHFAGGGIYNGDSDSATISSCSFRGNTALNVPGGGGMYSAADGTLPIVSDSVFCGNSEENIVGEWSDMGGNCLASTCADADHDGLPDECGGGCAEDVDGDDDVGFDDILAVLSAWGSAGGPEDVDNSGDVGFGDILAILSSWGPC